jgi:hypothetical protein
MQVGLMGFGNTITSPKSFLNSRFHDSSIQSGHEA